MTDSAHASGTDRIAEVARRLDWPDERVIVNVQGDEPLLPPVLVSQVAGLLNDDPECRHGDARNSDRGRRRVGRPQRGQGGHGPALPGPVFQPLPYSHGRATARGRPRVRCAMWACTAIGFGRSRLSPGRGLADWSCRNGWNSSAHCGSGSRFMSPRRAKCLPGAWIRKKICRLCAKC